MSFNTSNWYLRWYTTIAQVNQTIQGRTHDADEEFGGTDNETPTDQHSPFKRIDSDKEDPKSISNNESDEDYVESNGGEEIGENSVDGDKNHKK